MIKILSDFLPIADSAYVGGVRVGGGLSITTDGVLSATGEAVSTSILTELQSGTYLASNQGGGTVVVDSSGVAGEYVALTRYTALNGIFIQGGDNEQYVLAYTDNETIRDEIDQFDHQAILLNSEGNTSFPGTVSAIAFSGTTISTAWGDLAERYISDVEYPIGTLVCFGGEKEITAAEEEANAVISEEPAIVLNNNAEGQPIALSGKVKVRTLGKVKKFDKLALSEEPGVAHKAGEYDTIIAIALEENDSEDEKLVMCVTKLSF